MGANMPKRKHTTEELRGSSNHLWYEIWMYQSLVAGMGSGIAGVGVINNTLLEAFAIHVRVLIHFFYSVNPKKDDVVAEHFFEDSQDWKRQIPPKTEILKAAKKRADKEVAHLTYSRLKVAPEKKPWNFMEISNDLQVVVSKFIKLCPRDILGDRWENTVSALNDNSEGAAD